MSSGSRISDVLSTINSLPRRSSAGESLRSIITSGSKRKQKATSKYRPYSVYDQMMSPPILRDSEALRKLLEAIYESPSGRRSLSRLARTCKALCEPALAILWRELDSLIPILGLFPADMLRKARKPGLGLSRPPRGDEWTKVLRYSELVHRLAYDETVNNVSPSVFPILQEHRPNPYILPNLQQLVWKVETAPALDRSKMFLNPALEGLVLEVGPHTNQIDAFIADVSSRLKLKYFSFISPTSLPNSFSELLLPQDTLERLILEAPGALSPGVGRWIASLSRLRSFHIDLTGRSVIAVEGFFDEIHPRSGDSTPSSVGTTDSGVFSGEEVDFSDIRKAALRLTGDLGSKGSFGQLRHLNLSGDVSNIAVFLKHIPSPLTQLDLVIDDPPDKNDWQDLSSMLSDKFGQSLQSLRISATRFSDSLRPKGDDHLSLQHLGFLPLLYRLEIDLPESVLFTPEDITNLASACPNLEELRLSPLARFALSGSSPKLDLESLAPLMTNCRRLHTMAVVINARRGSSEVLSSQTASSDSLLRLHVGHSWITDPLHVTILLSHLCPRLETLKWFHEKNRPGFIEAHARGWEKVLDALPHLQNVRLTERLSAPRVVEYVYVPEQIVLPETADKSVDATVIAIDKGVLVRPRIAHGAVQASPVLVGCGIDARPRLASVSVAASPEYAEQQIDASVSVTSQSVDARPETTVAYVDATEPERVDRPLFRPFVLQTIITLFTLPWKALVFPFTVSSSIFRKIFSSIHWPKRNNGAAEQSTIPMNIMPAYAQSTSQNMQPMPMAETHDNTEPEVQVRNWIRIKTDNNTRDRTRTHLLNSTWMAERKQEKDFTKEVDELLPITASLADAGKLEDALDKLLTLEKQTRNAADVKSTATLLKTVAEYCYKARDYAQLNSNIILLSKKHGQLKAAVQAIVEQAVAWLPDIQKESTERWIELLETLRSVTEGKIYLETPRARVTLLLSHHHESLANSPPDGQKSLETASELLSDLQVETYSSMERREKTEFILEQMRLLIAVAQQKDDAAKKDNKLGGGESEWVKAKVGSRKISEAFLKEKENEDLKLKYYDLMIQHSLHHEEYLDVAQHYYKVWETPSIKEDVSDKGKAALEHIVYYSILAPHSNEQSDLIHRLFNDPALAKLELHYNLVKSFTTIELMRWPGIVSIFGDFLKKTPVFSNSKRWEDLHTRVIEHNIRVVAKYYSRITLARLTSLLDLSARETEETLARLVVSGTVWARMDRPAGIINFQAKRSAEEVMNNWSSDMQKLLGLVEKTWMGMNAAQAAQSRVKAVASVET